MKKDFIYINEDKQRIVYQRREKELVNGRRRYSTTKKCRIKKDEGLLYAYLLRKGIYVEKPMFFCFFL